MRALFKAGAGGIVPFVIGADLQKRLRVYGTAGVVLMALGNRNKGRNSFKTFLSTFI